MIEISGLKCSSSREGLNPRLLSDRANGIFFFSLDKTPNKKKKLAAAKFLADGNFLSGQKELIEF